MKKVLLSVILLLGLVNVYGQTLTVQDMTVERFDSLKSTTKSKLERINQQLESYKQFDSLKSTKVSPVFGREVFETKAQLESYNQLVSEEAAKSAPTFKLRDEIAIPDISTYYTPAGTIPTNMGEVYDKGLKLILKGKDKNAYKYFIKIINNKKCSYELKQHAYYQLAHFDWFKCFDKYYNGVPSNMVRLQKSFLGETNHLHSFKDANIKSCLLMCANPIFPTYNLELVVTKGTSLLNSKDYESRLFAQSVFSAACNSNLANNVDLLQIWKNGNKSIFYIDAFDEIVEQTKVLPYLCRMKNNTINTANMTAVELCKEGNRLYKSQKNIDAFYYYARSSFYGNAEAYQKLFEVIDKLYSDELSDDISRLKKIDRSDYLIREKLHRRYYLAESISKCNQLSDFKEVSKFYMEDYKKEYEDFKNYMHDKQRQEYAEKEARKERRRQFWLGALQGALQSMNGVANQMAYQQQYNMASPQMSAMPNMGNMNSLLDPRLAIAQVNAQDYARYQSAREAYQRMGKDLSVDEWRAMEGQALLNLKEQGIDLVAEQAERNRQDRQEWRESLDAERKQRLNRLGADTSDMSDASNNASSKTSSSSTTKSSGTGSQTSSASNNDLDSKQQYQREAVSSDDYHFEKHVTLYIRDGNLNRVMFSNKDLCKKGAYYFVKIDNTYYRVQAQGGWGFNSSILYSTSKLYFNK